MAELKCLNPWDPQSKRQYGIDGCYCTLNAGHSMGGQAHGVCYALEGNGSRDSHKGPGYTDSNTMYTLNTIEHHAVCYAIEGNTADRKSIKNGKGWCENVAPTLNTQDRHAVCYAIDCRNGEINQEISGTLQCHAKGGRSVNCTNPVMYEEKHGRS